jgi:hypothetical protein
MTANSEIASSARAFSATQLREAARAAGVGKSAVVLEDLRDTDAVLAACGL